MGKKNILFVCRYNRFRSKVAEALFKRYNKNKGYSAKSAGIIRGSPPEPYKRLLGEFNVKINGPTRGLSTEILKWQDITIIVADDVPKGIFMDNKKHGKDVLVWKIPDNKTDNEKEIRRIVESIEKKVRNFTESLNEQKRI
jgi:protein-tyrosine-phosphatase